MQKIKFKNKIEALLANHNNFDLMQKKQLNYLISNLKNIIYMLCTSQEKVDTKPNIYL